MSRLVAAYLKKEQIGTLFVLMGAPEGGFRGGRGQGGPAQKSYVPIQMFFLAPPGYNVTDSVVPFNPFQGFLL
jgi:hypothetical protein